MRTILLIMIGLSVSAWAGFSRDDVTQIVTDNNTGLQWQDNVNISKAWIDAIDYCETLTLGGYTDWRLPNEKELLSTVDYATYAPSISSVFQNISFYNYWSSTTYTYNTSYAWVVHFSHGYTNYYNKSSSFYVRCVR